MEEEEAAAVYFSRGRTAKKAGDEKTHDLYRHVRGEEEHHREEFTKRYGELSRPQYSTTVKPSVTDETTRLQELEFGKKEVSLPIKEDFSDAMTLREMASKLEDGLYTAGDNYVYSVINGKVQALPQYRSRYDYKAGKFIFTERPLTSENINEIPIFHGTTDKSVTLGNISVERSGQNFQGVGGNEFDGVYFTTRPSEAKGYGELGKERRVEANLVEARISSDAKVIKYKDVGTRNTEELLADGVDVVLKYEKAGDIGEVIILNPKVLVTPPKVAIPQTSRYWVKVKDPGKTSFTPGAIISYEEFERENAKVRERGEKPASIEIRYRYGMGNGQPTPDNGDGDTKLPATVEGEPIPEKYRELTPLINEPLPPGVDFLPAVVPEEGERKIDTVLRQLQSGVESIQDSNQFRIFLTTMAKFHNYSIGNQILIAIQKPEATKVAGFNTWKDLGRFVKRGEKAIAILAPVMPPKPKKEEVEEAEAEELMAPQPVYFKVVSVFDISQTEGKPLPEFDVPVLTGAANDELFAKAVTLARNQGLEVTYEPMPQMDPAVMGFYSGKTIWIKPGESDAQQLKTLLHEMAHYYSEGVFRIPRQTAETIAESAAFAVGAHFGFDSGVRSFPYVALWAQDKKVLDANLASIRKVASVMLESLEKVTIQTNVLPERDKVLTFMPDSPEYLTQTIDASGWREQLDQAFQEAMTRVRM